MKRYTYEMVTPKNPKAVGMDTQGRILKAAEKMFRRHGYAGATMDDIAADAAVEKANIYYYFKGKEQLHQAMHDRVRSELQACLDSAAALTDPWQRLEALVSGAVAIASELPGFIPLAFDGLVHPLPAGHDLHEVLEGGLRSALEHGKKQKAFAVSEVEPLVYTMTGALMRTLLAGAASSQSAVLGHFRKLLA